LLEQERFDEAKECYYTLFKPIIEVVAVSVPLWQQIMRGVGLGDFPQTITELYRWSLVNWHIIVIGFLVVHRVGVIMAPLIQKWDSFVKRIMLSILSWLSGPEVRPVGDLVPQVVEGDVKVDPTGNPYVLVSIGGKDVHVQIPEKSLLVRRTTSNLESQRFDEMLIVGSPMDIVNGIPPGLGSVRVRNQVIGMYSRIKVGNTTLLATAAHVARQMYDIPCTEIEHNGKAVSLDVSWPIFAISHTLDFCFIEVPEVVWSSLGIKSLALGIPAPSGVVSTYGYNEVGELAVSDGRASSVDSFFYYHSASTRPSWSGTPLMSAGKVVGMHVKSAPAKHKNVAVLFQRVVIPTVEYDTRRKVMQQLRSTDREWRKRADVYYPASNRWTVLGVDHTDFAVIETYDRDFEEDLSFLDEEPFSLFDADAKDKRKWYDENAGAEITGGSDTQLTRPDFRMSPQDLPSFRTLSGSMASETTNGNSGKTTPVRQVKHSNTLEKEESSSEVNSVRKSPPGSPKLKRTRQLSVESQGSLSGNGLSEVETPSSSPSSSKTEDIVASLDPELFKQVLIKCLNDILKPQSQEGLVVSQKKRKTSKGKVKNSESSSTSNTQ
jgi:hypothetical protein